MLNLTKTQKICIQYGFLLLLICMTVYLVSTTLDITLIPMIMKLVNKKFIFIGFLIMVLYIIRMYNNKYINKNYTKNKSKIFSC